MRYKPRYAPPSNPPRTVYPPKPKPCACEKDEEIRRLQGVIRELKDKESPRDIAINTLVMLSKAGRSDEVRRQASFDLLSFGV